MCGDKKLIYFLVALIICLSIILLIKIEMTPKYNPKIYEEVYDEYENIFKNNENNNIQENNIEQESFNIINHNNDNNQTTDMNYTEPSSMGQGSVIGKIIIPKIDIKYPIIKETTTEYLKVAPAKYCGPEVNEIRKFSYSGA